MITRKQFDILDQAIILWKRTQWHTVTSCQIRKREIIKLINLDLMESAGKVYMCDGDGFLVDSERTREGYKVTEKGYQAHKEYEEKDINNAQERKSN